MDPINLIIIILVALLALLGVGVGLYFFWPKDDQTHQDNIPLHARLGRQTAEERTTTPPHFVSGSHSAARLMRSDPARGGDDPEQREQQPKPAPEPPPPPPPPPPPTPKERFATEPEAAFVDQFRHVDHLLSENLEKLRKIDEIFAVRMHKNTNADIANHLLAQDIIDALNKRRDLMAEILSGTSERGKTAEDAFEIAFGKLEIGGNKFGSLSLSEKPTAKYLDIEEIQSELKRILLEFQRRKTFFNALFPKDLLGRDK